MTRADVKILIQWGFGLSWLNKDVDLVRILIQNGVAHTDVTILNQLTLWGFWFSKNFHSIRGDTYWCDNCDSICGDTCWCNDLDLVMIWTKLTLWGFWLSWLNDDFDSIWGDTCWCRLVTKRWNTFFVFHDFWIVIFAARFWKSAKCGKRETLSVVKGIYFVSLKEALHEALARYLRLRLFTELGIWTSAWAWIVQN